MPFRRGGIPDQPGIRTGRTTRQQDGDQGGADMGTGSFRMSQRRPEKADSPASRVTSYGAGIADYFERKVQITIQE